MNFAFHRKLHGNFIFLANGYNLGQNSIKLTPLRIQFYFRTVLPYPQTPFLMLGSGISLILVSFSLFFAF